MVLKNERSCVRETCDQRRTACDEETNITEWRERWRRMWLKRKKEGRTNKIG